MGAMGPIVEDTGMGDTTTLEPSTTTMPARTPILLLRTTGCYWQARVLWVAFGAGMWAGRWRSSWSSSLGEETGEVAPSLLLARTLGEREPSQMTTGDCWNTCSAFPGIDSSFFKYLKCQSDDPPHSWKWLRLIVTSKNPIASFTAVSLDKEVKMLFT